MRRPHIAILVAVLCAIAATLVVLLAAADDPAPPAAESLSRGEAERTLRTYLTHPGPDRIAPDGTLPGPIACRRSERGWRCKAFYPGRIRVTCLVPDKVRGALAVAPICD